MGYLFGSLSLTSDLATRARRRRESGSSTCHRPSGINRQTGIISKRNGRRKEPQGEPYGHRFGDRTGRGTVDRVELAVSGVLSLT